MAVSTLKEKNMRLPGTSTGSEAEIQQCVPASGLHKGSQKHHTELAMLKIIRGLDPINLVWFLESFEHKWYSCLAFERLDMNLHQLLNDSPGNPLSLEEIKPITQQLLSALKSLKTVGVITLISNLRTSCC
ncbi:hypothetical protein KUCAC02_023988 [Chaenocephalus aceratus]|uniref:Uncharacterized protein n=1 Tax=Chaenocephalus aceratus TaxID=36190 RepID=A0ACB9WGU5_CHAAC|nr:hypothetical protein KUCAC02_023988 [Chaenocephalus aceratus]